MFYLASSLFSVVFRTILAIGLRLIIDCLARNPKFLVSPGAQVDGAAPGTAEGPIGIAIPCRLCPASGAEKLAVNFYLFYFSHLSPFPECRG
jgi:hypothetical protein